jgi:hypothetical protein
VFSPNSQPGGWYCQMCLPGQFCYNNTNKTCPAYSTSLADAGDVLDCYCNPGYANATIQTEANLCRECPVNYYCTGKGNISMCVANAVSPTQSQTSSRCYCDWGWKGVNNTVCVECTSPTYCYGGIQALCPSGSFSLPRAWDRSNCSCFPGYWGPVGELITCKNRCDDWFDKGKGAKSDTIFLQGGLVWPVYKVNTTTYPDVETAQAQSTQTVLFVRQALFRTCLPGIQVDVMHATLESFHRPV